MGGNGEMKGNGVIGTEVFDGSCYSIKSGNKIFSLTTEKNPENDPLIAWFRLEGNEIVVDYIMGGLTNQQNEGAVRVCEVEDLERNKTSFNDCQQVEKQKFGEEYQPKYANGAVFIKDSQTDDYKKITNGRTISVALIVIQYFLLTFGEVLLSTTALDFIYPQAPSSARAISPAY